MTTLHGLLVVDKPRGWTSHDVVAWVRRRLATRRVGHGGTLDPAAEGVLVVLVGQATRLTPYLQEASKQYVAHIVLGARSSTDDLEGELTLLEEVRVPSTDEVECALRRFRGEFEQQPPAFSAVKVGGKPLYQQARAGREVEAYPRRVIVHHIELVRYAYPDVVVTVDCGKGFYVRSLARDLGDVLGTGAYLHGLVRTRVGPFGLADAWSLPELEPLLTQETWRYAAVHPDVVLAHLAAVVIDMFQTQAWYHGAPVCPLRASPARDPARVYGTDGRWLGIARYRADDGRWWPELVVSDRLD